jgi:membrane protein YdbS with pleckstrin-like domain
MEPTPADRPAAAPPVAGPAAREASRTGSPNVPQNAQGNAPKRPGMVTRVRRVLDAMSMSAVIFWVALSMGLLLVWVQTTSNWMTALCSLVWAITAVVLVGRFDGQHAAAVRRRHVAAS